MFLTLGFPGGDKQVSIMVRDLPCQSHLFIYDTERNRAERAVEIANKRLGEGCNSLIHMLFHQYDWEGTTGYEYWTREYDKVLKHALVVAKTLGVPLHVHKSFDDELFAAAEKAGIEFDFVGAERVENPVSRDFEFFNDRIETEYIMLTDVVLPAGTPEVTLF